MGSSVWRTCISFTLYALSLLSSRDGKDYIRNPIHEVVHVMLHRVALMVLAVVASLAVFGAVQAQTTEKVVTLTPTSGPPGTVVTAELSGAPPNDPITVIFKIP